MTYDCTWTFRSPDGSYRGAIQAPTDVADVVGWGLQVTADEEAFRWFKLALARPEGLGDGVDLGCAD